MRAKRPNEMANITRVISRPLSLLQGQQSKVGSGFRLPDQIPAVSYQLCDPGQVNKPL